MNLEERYKKETGGDSARYNDLYSFEYVSWLEEKVHELERENSEYEYALKVLEKDLDALKSKNKPK